jgi:aminoglycoside phosphotransferase (APT) family kinase protein
MDEEIRTLVSRHLPGRRLGAVTKLGEGWDNVAWQTGDGLVIRLGKEPDLAERAGDIRREAAVLDLAAEVSTLRVPKVLFADPDAGVLVYEKVEGEPVRLGLVADAGALAATMGAFVSRLHRVPLARVEGLVRRDAEPMSAWLAEAARNHAQIAALLPGTARARVERFLGRRPPAEPRTVVFCHNDLGTEHILADAAGAVTGVIDWSDAALADPAHDLALLYRDLGPEVFDLTVASYEGHWDGPSRARALFYARCALLDDIAYAVRTGAGADVRRALAKLAWTFA